MLAAYPNIERWLEPVIRRLRRFSDDEYVVLRDELANVETEGQYVRDLERLDHHLALAATNCSGFGRLISERSKVGGDLHSANRMVLDKLSEIRAIVGLHHLSFYDISYGGSPDLCASRDGTTYGVEVTRLAASGGMRSFDEFADFKITVVVQGDDSADDLANQLFAKIMTKREQLLRTPFAHGKHIIWISTGRDYLTAGLYERELAGLRPRMPRDVAGKLDRAIDKVQRTCHYPQLSYVVASRGRDSEDVPREVKHD